MQNRLAKIVLTSCLALSTALVAKEQSKPQQMAPKVDVYIVKEQKEVPLSLKYPARIDSAKEVTITARVSGVLQKQFYKEGEPLKEGSLMYQIEPDIFAADYASKKATLAVEDAKMQKAKKDFERAEGLYKEQAISEQEYDNAHFSYLSAKANAGVAKAELQKAQVNLDYTKVKATISGVTGMRLVDAGDYVTAGTPLVKMLQRDPIYAEFSIPNISKIKKKFQGVKLQAKLLVNGVEYPETGYVDFIDSSIDKSTSTTKARAVFKNPDAKLLSGEFAEIKLIGAVAKNIITVPQKAVLQNPLGTIVFVVVEGKAEVRPVRIIESSGDKFIVSGVKPKDVVVVNNFFRVRPNSPVTIDKTINAQAK
ncbi:MAG: efflux RND transporter periplasmic adaptor subunit [Sulfurimonas sp.]